MIATEHAARPESCKLLPMPSAAHPLHHRLKAARFLAGYSAAADFAEHIPGIDSRGPVSKMESGDQAPTPQQLAAWAKACGVPLDFFFVDFASISVPEAPIEGDVFEQLDALEKRIGAARASGR